MKKNTDILSPDNRQYEYGNNTLYTRGEFPIICDWVKNGTKIIDLGSGNGSLMYYIAKRKQVDIQGIDNSSSGVNFSNTLGFKTVCKEIDKEETYNNYIDNEFDYAICNVTIQMVLYPEVLFKQMRRISRYQIISFPNFAYLANRLDLLCFGRMPRPQLFGYKWYTTGHIHQLSVRDFKEFCKKERCNIVDAKYLGYLASLGKYFSPNLFSRTAIMLCEKS